MNSVDKITQLYEAINVMGNMPVAEITENPNLVQDLKGILAKANLGGIINDIYNERSREKMAALNSDPTKPKFGMDSPEMHRLYAKYQSAAHPIVSRGSQTAWTDKVTFQGLQAHNSKSRGRKNPFTYKRVTDLPETKRFKEAFNSIYSDQSLQIGTAADPTLMGSYIDYSPYIWNYQYYISIPTLSQTVDFPINMATRKTPRIIFDDHELSLKVEQWIKRSRFNEKVTKMVFYSMLSPRGSLIVPIVNDGTDGTEAGTIRFNTFNDTQFTYATSYQYSRIDFKDNQTGVSQLFCLGHMLQNEVTAHFLCPGFEPIFAIGKNKLYQLKDAAEAVNIYLYTVKVLCIRAQILVEKWAGEGQNDTKLAALRRMSQQIDRRLSLSTSVKLPDDADLDIINNNLTEGFAKTSQIIKEYQGMLSGVMGDYYYGSDSAYSANSFNLNVTHQNIHSQIQEEQIAPIYRFAINKLLESDPRFTGSKVNPGEFDIEFESLYEPTEMEKLDADAKKIANYVQMRDNPELEELFKKEGLLPDEFTFENLPAPEPQPMT